MSLALYHDSPSSENAAQSFLDQRVVEEVRRIDTLAREGGLSGLSASDSEFVALGMEMVDGRVVKNGLGHFHLSWLSQQHPEWVETLETEAKQIRDGVRAAHGVPLRFIIWCGMGGSAEDKALYRGAGLLKRGPLFFVLDSTDPAKMNAIFEEIQRKTSLHLAEILQSTLIVGQSLGMTSYEPVINLQAIARLYDKFKIDSTANIIYLTLTDSLLYQFAKSRGYRRFELQMDGGNTTSGRHSSPLTRGSLLPLALAHHDLREWLKGTWLSEEEIAEACRLAAFIHTQATNGHKMITLMLPKAWEPAAMWTKQNFEESLGKSESFGIKIIIQEKLKPVFLELAKSARQDRAFVCVQARKHLNPHADLVGQLRRLGYPVALPTLGGDSLSRYMQYIHWVVLGVAWLQKMNFVTQPSVELYKSITADLMTRAEAAGGIAATAEWESHLKSDQSKRFESRVTLHHPNYRSLPLGGLQAPDRYAAIIKDLVTRRQIDYFELTFFGDLRYSREGLELRRILDAAATNIFKKRLHQVVDVYEGPAMNHSYHEMILGHGRCLSTVILPEKGDVMKTANHTAEYHRAQFLATQMALERRGRHVVAITLKDLEESSLESLQRFFTEAAKTVPHR